ncbi:MAG: hypothetical protein NWF08_05110 [Candidatus Bathyarchaeota archaeon]|jgi:hypothetical protein|nr:hypothetical protein [Candidatus Bathyarchaeota archaeon]
MSAEEKLRTIIQEIKDIFLDLTQGEPTPDDEIEARVNLIEKIQDLKNIDTFQVGANMRLFEDTLIKLENWDTLDLWFSETELPDDIAKVINITDNVPEVEHEEHVEKDISKKAHENLTAVQYDIDKIVDQVSDKFKGEIDDLKEKIDLLKHELEVKDETLKQVSQKKVVKKITPKKDVRLPPPTIKIPSIGKPEVAPHVRAPIKTETEKSPERIGVKSIEQVQAKIEKEIEKLTPIPKIDEKTHIYEEMHEEAKSVLHILEDLEPVPGISQPDTDGSSSILDIIDEQESDSKTLVPKVIEVNTEDSKEPPFTAEILPIEEVVPEKKDKSPFIAKKPKVTTVSVEEIESEDIKSSGMELFDVFNSVGDIPASKPSPSIELPSFEPVKEKKKKEAKKKKKEPDATKFIDFNAPEPQIPEEEESVSISEQELPTDKDSLYQELIALEGRRYSLEKNFKEIEKSYNSGSIDDFDYRKRGEDLKIRLDEITSRINRIRRIIASM